MTTVKAHEPYSLQVLPLNTEVFPADDGLAIRPKRTERRRSNPSSPSTSRTHITADQWSPDCCSAPSLDCSAASSPTTITPSYDYSFGMDAPPCFPPFYQPFCDESGTVWYHGPPPYVADYSFDPRVGQNRTTTKKKSPTPQSNSKSPKSSTASPPSQAAKAANPGAAAPVHVVLEPCRVATVKLRYSNTRVNMNGDEFDTFTPGTFVIFEGDRGYDLGEILVVNDTTVPEADRRGMKKMLRLATDEEIKTYHTELVELEAASLVEADEIVKSHLKSMTLIHCQYQFDKQKVTLFYTCENRKYFVPLLKALYFRFRCRIWMDRLPARSNSAE